MVKKIFILGGGTGGHIIPARCVAKELSKNGFFVQFFGDEKIRNYSQKNDVFTTKILLSAKFQKSALKMAKAVILIGLGFLQSFFAILRFRPNLVIAFGGYSSFPMLVAAVILRRKIFLHEQNAHLGKVNRYFAPFASKVLLGFQKVDAMKENWQKKSVYVGNPVRDEILDLQNQQYHGFVIKNNENSSADFLEDYRELNEIFANKFGEFEEFDENEEDFDDEFEFTEEEKIYTKNNHHKNHNFPKKNKKNSGSIGEFIIKEPDSIERNIAEFSSNIAFAKIKNSLDPKNAAEVTDIGNKKMGYNLLLASDFVEKIERKKLQNFSGQNPSEKFFEILVIGGSGGAKIFSEILPKAFFNLPKFIKKQIFIYQQCRTDLVQSTLKQYQNFGINAEVADFFNDMKTRLKNCDLMIARAGASTISEITIAKKPAILVPYSLAADDHQSKNARIFADKNAAIVIPEKDFTINKMQQVLNSLITDCALLQNISKNLENFAKPDSAAKIAAITSEFLQ